MLIMESKRIARPSVRDHHYRVAPPALTWDDRRFNAVRTEVTIVASACWSVIETKELAKNDDPWFSVQSQPCTTSGSVAFRHEFCGTMISPQGNHPILRSKGCGKHCGDRKQLPMVATSRGAGLEGRMRHRNFVDDTVPQAVAEPSSGQFFRLAERGLRTPHGGRSAEDLPKPRIHRYQTALS